MSNAEFSSEAKAVLGCAADACRSAFGERFLAAYALGSLAHGGFSPLVSDVDLGLVVADPLRAEDAETVNAGARAARAMRSPLAARLSVFWGTPLTLRGGMEGGRFPPVDRLDLIENGRLLAGVDVRSGLARPSRLELLVSGAEFALALLAQAPDEVRRSVGAGLGSMAPAREDTIREICDPQHLVSHGTRRVTKLVLFPVRFMFTAATGRVGTNQDAAAWYLGRDDVPARELVAGALAWRDAPPDEAEVVTLLRDQLVPLYRHYIEDQAARLGVAGQAELVRGFDRWRDRLEAEVARSQARRFAS